MIKNGVFLGQRLRRLRRDLGLTQADMAGDLEISASYIALMERNQRPLTAEILLRLARTYKVDFSEFGENSGPGLVARLEGTFRDPLFADIDILPLEVADIAHSFPGFAEAMLRLHTAYKEEQFALADQRQSTTGASNATPGDPVAAVRTFLAARQNYFPALDAAGERLSGALSEAGGLVSYLKQRHGLVVRRVPSEVMTGSLRRLDWHRKEILLDEALGAESQGFHLAQQLAYLEFQAQLQASVDEGAFENENARRLAHRALSAYGAAAIIMPYAAFARAVEKRRYDIEALSSQFGASFEQTAHRLTTLHRPGLERIPFFFIKVDIAGNVSKRLNTGSFPFARHGGGCPLWGLHATFTAPSRISTQWLELPDGQRFFSIARTVSSGGRSFSSIRVDRAIALVCEAKHAGKMVYAREQDNPVPTPIGISCRLCHRTSCTARSEPPIGRQILADNLRRTEAPFGFSDS